MAVEKKVVAKKKTTKRRVTKKAGARPMKKARAKRK